MSSIPQPKQTSYSYSAITNENVKNLYAQIESECQKPVPEEIQCTGKLSQKDIYEAIVAFKNDHPDIFWLKNTFTYYDYDGSTHIELAYITSGDALEEQKENFNTALSSFVDNATMYYSEYEREKYVNDFIVDNCEYDTEAAKSDYTTGNVSTAYGVLVEGKAICEGYARAFQLLCNKLGIECVSVTGMTDNVGHAWNCARIDGDWCQVDVTWNDSGNEVDRYYYFNLTDEQMYATHRPDDYFADIEPENYNNDENLIGNLYIPECTTTSHNYYMNTASMLYDFDDETYDNIVTNLALAALNGDKKYNILHICGEPEYQFETHVEWFKNYPADLINWSVKDNHFSLEQGRELYSSAILGGMNNKGNVLNGSEDAIREEVKGILDAFGTKGIMIGADCTIQGENISLDLIKTAVEAAHAYKK